ncbi:hypothetical protein F2Q69_00053594 [Brassica cretica]|uniref:Transposase MuDR plant domain-containing protein n=1 Tax=Brassica cretica TaxID=69181 RepID=A0A8S9MVF4_BRACR|nr:hypothetical protein F2Q69_00053594 [Brassica cretica]
MEICAMKHNFDYKVGKTDRRVWYVRCADDDCRWRVRAEGLTGSSYFIIKKYVPDHSCSPSSRNHSVRTASSKTVGSLIMHKYESVKEGPKPNDIIQFMRNDHGVEISYSLAWEAREYDVRTNNPAESINSSLRSPREFPVIPLLDSIREMMTLWFFKSRTLSSKHKQPLTVAVEKKIDRRIEKGKKFQVFPVSDDRHAIKAAFSVGIQAHTLTDDMYTTASWRSIYEESINPIGVPEDAWIVPSHVQQAKVLPPETRRAAGRRKKRRYDVRTNNPAESINSSLRSPREFPVIPLLDSIREMMTLWFFKSRTLSSKHKQPLTVAVEKKIDRRIEKGKKFQVFPVSDDRHAIKAAFSVGIQAHTLTDDMYTTASWRSIYEESINLISVLEDAWIFPSHVQQAKVLPPETRRAAGRRKKRMYETVEDKIRSSQGTQSSKHRKCSRCGIEGHNRSTCDRAI